MLWLQSDLILAGHIYQTVASSCDGVDLLWKTDRLNGKSRLFPFTLRSFGFSFSWGRISGGVWPVVRHLCLSALVTVKVFFKDNTTRRISASSTGVQCTGCIIVCKFNLSEGDRSHVTDFFFFTIFQKLKNFRVLKARRTMKTRNISMLSATKT